MHLCISTRTLVGPRRFNSGSAARCPFERCRKFARQDQTSCGFSKIGVSRTWMAVRICSDGPFYLHFTGAPAKGKRSSQNQLASSHFSENFRLSSSRQLICMIFDQRHVNASHDPLASIVSCKTKRCEWAMAHCSGTKSNTGMQRVSLWALSVASSSIFISTPSKVRPEGCSQSWPFALRGLAKLWGSVEHGCQRVSAPKGRFARNSLALERKAKEALRDDSQRHASLRSVNASKHETHLEKEQVRQSVRTSCGGLVKLLAPQN